MLPSDGPMRPSLLHLVDDPGRPGVAELEPPLEVGGRGLAGVEDELDGLLVALVLLPVVLPGVVGVALDDLDDALVVGRRALALDELDQPPDLGDGDVGAVEADEAREVGRQEEHVAHAQELVGADGVDDDPGVDLGRDAEGDAAGEVVLDRAGDDVDRRPLGGHDEVDADGPGQLGQPADEELDLLGADHHQLGQLVDDDDDVGEGLEALLLLVGELALLLGQELLHLLCCTGRCSGP